MRSRTLSRTVAAVLVAGVLLAPGLMPAGAGGAGPAITVSLTEGPPGTEITISGSNCPPDPSWGERDWEVRISGMALDAGAPLAQGENVPPDTESDTDTPWPPPPPWLDPDLVFASHATPDAAGDWSVSLAIPHNRLHHTNLPVPDQIAVSAFCRADFMEEGAVRYAGATFTVTDPPIDEPEAEVEADQAEPATPVEQLPTFTG
jgi:hypothetical protein